MYSVGTQGKSSLRAGGDPRGCHLRAYLVTGQGHASMSMLVGDCKSTNVIVKICAKQALGQRQSSRSGR